MTEEIKRRMDQEPDEETVIMKSQMQEVEERVNRNNDYKAKKKLEEKAKYARTGAIKEVKRSGGNYFRAEGKKSEDKYAAKLANKADRARAKRGEEALAVGTERKKLKEKYTAKMTDRAELAKKASERARK